MAVRRCIGNWPQRLRFNRGIASHCFDEAEIRDRIREVAPERADAKRPFRLAVIQLGTYDGTIYNARQVVDKIGHLCDYILFDSAWVGYEQFISWCVTARRYYLN